ncbi:uncharacterized protein LOC111593810 [Drosophila hydei]|uniref:Uncharacterized protein LOC111593810 n=1 Tax=Drosophila hydei TaxID=7224 RepID=A0A6J1LGZ7_DROHY|nr:uncharacterized protein LOC111593810 [Drosophila hydei]
MADEEIVNIDSIPEVHKTDSIINDIIEDIFHQYKESDSQSETQLCPCSTISFVDNRLKYWKNMIRERRALHRKLSLATGRLPKELLFNQDNRDEQTIKRVLDQVSRRDSSALSTLTDSCSRRRESHNIMEFVGLPKPITMELDCPAYLRSPLLESQVLDKRLQQEKAGIKHLLEFCPNVEYLMLIGRNIWRRDPCVRTSLHTISSITPGEITECPTEILVALNTNDISLPDANSEIAVSFNGTTYRRHRPEFSPIVERKFVCHPYEYSYRTIIHIENNGCQTINFKWSSSEFFAYNVTLFKKPDDVFVFDSEPFILRPGGVRDVSVLFRPCQVGIVKQRWLLKTSPCIFFRFPYALTLNMHGKCTPPREYLKLLKEKKKCNPRNYSNNRRKVVQIMPHSLKILCPYSRELDDSEAFNQRNVGFHCERKLDIIELKRFFGLVKPENCSLEWDYSVSLIIELISIKQDTRLRVSLFEQLQALLAPLRGRTTPPLKLSDSINMLKQRQCTKLIYVRGAICNGIDLWEENFTMLAKQKLKGDSRSQTKFLRDAIYMYTYNKLCNIAENIASVIESTEHV